MLVFAQVFIGPAWGLRRGLRGQNVSPLKASLAALLGYVGADIVPSTLKGTTARVGWSRDRITPGPVATVNSQGFVQPRTSERPAQALCSGTNCVSGNTPAWAQCGRALEPLGARIRVPSSDRGSLSSFPAAQLSKCGRASSPLPALFRPGFPFSRQRPVSRPAPPQPPANVKCRLLIRPRNWR